LLSLGLADRIDLDLEEIAEKTLNGAKLSRDEPESKELREAND
jgi:hypothetical protein